jgi:ABC-type Fe3+ transport system substrate-binding protein
MAIEMKNKYFDSKDSLFNITEQYKQVIELLDSYGFENIKDATLRQNIGKNISLEMALSMKNIDTDSFLQQVIEKIEVSAKPANVSVKGVLPCPVRVPLLEGFENWLKENKEKLDMDISYELKAASFGLDWIKQDLVNSNSEEALADIFISAGFDLFFDKNLIGKYRDQGLFEDITGFEQYNKDFENETISLRDPDRQYSMLSVVPAVFLVNTEELGDRKMPTSWEDLLTPEFEQAVSLPIKDFDLFNSLLLTIDKQYGEQGVIKLGKSLLRSMHPAEMVKSHIKKVNKPAVTIMPYFFSKMTKEGGPMVPVWPTDGAIISPIFMLTKKKNKEKLKPIVDFLASKQVGEILAHNGNFPSINPDVDNRIPTENKYMWLGWDYIKANDIKKKISECEQLFLSHVKEV